MRQLIINVPDSQYSFFRKLLQQMPWAEVQKAQKVAVPPTAAPASPKAPAEQAWLDELREAFAEAKAHERGEIQLQDAREFLREL